MKSGYRVVMVSLVAGCLFYVLAGFRYQDQTSAGWVVSQMPAVQVELKEGEKTLTDPLGYVWVLNKTIEIRRGGVRVTGEGGQERQRQQGSPPAALMESWSVSDSLEQEVTTLTMPLGVAVEAIGEDFILGVWTDGSGTEYVRMYSLDRSG